MLRIFQMILRVSISLLFLFISACASKAIEVAANDNPKEVIQDLKLICKDLASNRVGNGDAAGNRVGNGDQANRVGNGSPMATTMMSAAAGSSANLTGALLKTQTGQAVYGKGTAERARAAKQVAEKLGEKDFNCP